MVKTGPLVKHGNARAGERHQLVGHQMNEQVRHRAVQALEGEPGKVARAGADTTQRHLGHALGGKAGDEAVAQVAHAADVDVAHRVVVSTRKDGEEVEVLRGSLHGVVWVLQAAQLHLRLQEAVLLPRRADGGHVLPRVGQQVDPLSQKVTNAPMSFVKARATVTLCSATPFGTLDCCVCTVG